MELIMPPPMSNCYTSAPSSPSRVSTIYADYREKAAFIAGVGESKDDSDGSGTEDFAFDFSGSNSGGLGGDMAHTATADELFESGRIRPLNPIDRSVHFAPPGETCTAADPPEVVARGRDRAAGHTGRRRATRSLPPLRRSGASDSGESIVRSGSSSTPTGQTNSPPILATFATITEYVKDGIRRWGMKNLMLFRSASEGRASGGRRDTLRKYTGLTPAATTMLSGKPTAVDHVKNESFRSVVSDGGSASKRRARRNSLVGEEREVSSSVVGGSARHASAHEILYARRNRAMSAELRKRTSLPYKQGLLCFLGFNTSVDGVVSGLSPVLGHRRL